MGIKSYNVQQCWETKQRCAGLLMQAGSESGLLVRINVLLIPGERLVDHRLENSQQNY
jgi:hypothetical protein